jgi:hypothetical protein
MSGDVDGTGAFTLENDTCIVVPAGQPQEPTGLRFDISGSGTKGSGITSAVLDLILDQDEPLICDEPPEISDPLSLTTHNMLHDSDIDETGAIDGDGCTSWDELGTVPGDGGQRDPWNAYDYFNPQKDGQNRVADILMVVGQFGTDFDEPGYTTQTDRTGLGPNAWNLGPPNGLQRVDDVLAAVKQFNHDC